MSIHVTNNLPSVGPGDPGPDVHGSGQSEVNY